MSGFMCSYMQPIVLCTSSTATTSTTTPVPRTLPHARTPWTTRMHGTTRTSRMSRISWSSRMHGTNGTDGTSWFTWMPRSARTATTTMSTHLHPLLHENLSTAVLHSPTSTNYASPTTPSSYAHAILCTFVCTGML